MEPPLQVQLFDLGQVDATQRSLGESVGRDQSQAEHTNPVDAVDGLGGGDAALTSDLHFSYVLMVLPTCSTRLIHWKLSSSVESGLCSATTTILSSLNTVTENTAILQGHGET